MQKATYKRYLKYRLYPTDVLFFRNIPGNGGELLYPLLDTHFAPGQIFLPVSAATPETFSELSESQRAQVRLVRGDFEYGTGDSAVYRYISRNPIKTTFLRHPVARALALYHQALADKRIGADASLQDYLTIPETRRNLVNAQAKAIVGQTTRAVMDHETFGYSLEAFRKLAEDNLDQHHFIGLAEATYQSLQLLHYIFDWDFPNEIQTFDPATQPTPTEEAAIANIVGYDLEFYDFAQKLFQRRYRQMVEELLEAEAHQRLVAQIPAKAVLAKPPLFTRIKRAIKRRLPGQKQRLAKKHKSKKNKTQSA